MARIVKGLGSDSHSAEESCRNLAIQLLVQLYWRATRGRFRLMKYPSGESALELAVRQRSKRSNWVAVNEEIITARRFGFVHCGLSSLPSPTIGELAREFGLCDDPSCYREIDEISARESVHKLLHRDQAYREQCRRQTVEPQSGALEPWNGCPRLRFAKNACGFRTTHRTFRNACAR